jgi:HPt (histidine-containing phosphotransfer) domain-containing protein
MPEAADLQGAIAALWDGARPRLLARVVALESAASGPFGEGERDRALIEAHTLAGTLGAFGRMDASEAARAAERALEAADRAALAEAVRTLRALT